MIDEKITDPNILRCALKKTVSVISKHILYASYAIIAISGVIYGVAAIWSVIREPLFVVVATMVSGLVAIPWYFYIVAAIPVAYFGYGLLWCIARELKEEDWKSEVAKTTALALAPALALALALAALAALSLSLALAALALALAPALALALALAALALADNSNYGKASYFAVRFIGAYINYARVRENPCL